MDQYTITITRQFGSMGQMIAKKMSEILGIEYYDDEILKKVAEQTGMLESTIEDEEERAESRFEFMGLTFGQQTSNVQDKIFKVQSQIIMELAEQQSCIIVGRCADYILRDFPNVVNIYIYAPEDDRIETCIERYNIPEREAKRRIEDVDEASIAYHMRYAGYAPDDQKHKDILINSSFLGFEGTAHYLCECIKEKFHISE